MKREQKELGIYFKTGNKVKFLIDECGITQTELCSKMPSDKKEVDTVSEKTLSRIVRGFAPLTESMAKKILKALPENPDRHYRLEWLMGTDERYMTEEEKEIAERDDIILSITREAEKREAVIEPVSDLMLLCGVKFAEPGPSDKIIFPLQPAATFGGFDLSGGDIERISNKMLALLKLELKYLVEEKKGQLTMKEYMERKNTF